MQVGVLFSPTIVQRVNDSLRLQSFRAATRRQGLEALSATSGFATRLAGAAERVDSLSELIRGLRPERSPSSAAIISAQPVLLDLSATSATVRSTEEVNTRTTEFSPAAPVFQGLSTLTVAADGTYDGSQATGTLTFEVVAGGVRGVSTLRIEARDPGGSPFHEIVIAPGDPTSTAYDVTNGLSLTFGDGIAALGDTFTIDVSAGVAIGVEADRPFDGSSGDPGLDEGLSVTDGSFEVNGETISVNAADSLNDVLARINDSAAGVTAALDTAADQVLLTQKTPGVGPTITLANDTSGFLAAVKLGSAVTVPGQSSDLDVTLDAVTPFAGVTSGTLSINSVDIDIDVSADTINDVLSRINESAASVGAELIGGNTFLIRSLATGQALELSDGGTGFLAAAGLGEGTVTPGARDVAPPQGRIKEVRAATEDAVSALNALVAVRMPPGFAAAAEVLRSALGDAVARASPGVTRPDLGFELDFSPAGGVTLGADEGAAFERALARDFDGIARFLVGGSAGGGVLDAFRAAIQGQIRLLPELRTGLLLDVYA